MEYKYSVEWNTIDNKFKVMDFDSKSEFSYGSGKSPQKAIEMAIGLTIKPHEIYNAFEEITNLFEMLYLHEDNIKLAEEELSWLEKIPDSSQHEKQAWNQIIQRLQRNKKEVEQKLEELGVDI